ncbi:hypothetical protein F4820DRAFT_413610 [Hypoxylon rubiginosum]|uniref:Uncharacterized protein n=1 Tax=Hypoxylon rubiginosum TaxID=110542 RepID=A0ACB9Z7I7_9PEZI|nr:hypothetical protein F4820DRAFT_413610 [Hypoxylon rubiginosum]
MSLEAYARDQVIDVFADSLKVVWIVAVAIAGASFFTVFIGREMGLRKELNTAYGLDEGEKRDGNMDQAVSNNKSILTSHGRASASTIDDT